VSAVGDLLRALRPLLRPRPRVVVVVVQPDLGVEPDTFDPAAHAKVHEAVDSEIDGLKARLDAVEAKRGVRDELWPRRSA
jgi:hypothetical protein